MPRTGKPDQLIGRQFGRLAVIGRKPGRRKRTIWRCLCVCGAERFVRQDFLVSGRINSCYACGKFRARQLATPEEKCWLAMIQRCTNPKAAGFHNYGGRGIKVCERWFNFENFLSDMGPRLSPHHSIDRYPDCNGNYEPTNCRWATRKEQMRNTRKNVKLVWQGKRRLLVELAEDCGIKRALVAKRLKHGWSLERTLTEKPRPRKTLALPPPT